MPNSVALVRAGFALNRLFQWTKDASSLLHRLWHGTKLGCVCVQAGRVVASKIHRFDGCFLFCNGCPFVVCMAGTHLVSLYGVVRLFDPRMGMCCGFLPISFHRAWWTPIRHRRFPASSPPLSRGGLNPGSDGHELLSFPFQKGTCRR